MKVKDMHETKRPKFDDTNLVSASTWATIQSSGDGGAYLRLHDDETRAQERVKDDPEPFTDNVFLLNLVIDVSSHRVYTLVDKIYAERQDVPIEHSRRLNRFGFLCGMSMRDDKEEEEVHRLAKELADAGIDHGWPIVPRELPKARKRRSR